MIWLNKNKFFNRYLPMILSVTLLVVGFGSYFLIKNALPAKSAWYSSANGTWNYRQKIVIDHTKVSTASSTTLSNFPVLISTTNVQFKDITNGGHVGKSDGSDIVFTSGDQLTKLNHEIETYASSTGQLIAWVQIPSLSPTVDTTLYMYYGNAAETGNEQNATAVWDSNYKGVWHFNERAGTTVNDSTSHGITGITANTTWTSSMWGTGAIAYNGSASTSLTNSSNFANLSNFTYSAWFYTNNNGGNQTVMGKPGFISMGSNAPSFNGQFYGSYRGWTASDLNVGSVGNVITNSAWSYATMTYIGSSCTLTIYINGQFLGSVSGCSTPPNDSSASLMIGYDSWGGRGFLNGAVTEPRIAAATRSPDWIKTEYNNQNSPSTFVSWGGEETQPTAQTNGSWYNAAYTYRKKIIINHQQVSGTSTLSNFPVLVSIASDPLLAYTGSGGHVASSTGGDILFTSSNGVLLNFEREKYASTTGELEAWVQVPSLSPTADTVIYLYYGNSSATDQQNKTATWDSNYGGIWHLANGITLSASDSTINANNGSFSATPPTPSVGKIDGGMAAVAASQEYIEVPFSSSINATHTGTFSAWVKFNSTANQVITSAGNIWLDNRAYGFYVYLNNLYFEIANASSQFNNVSVGTPATGQWYFLSGVWDGSNVNFYLNGVAQTPVSQTVDAANSSYFRIGGRGGPAGADPFFDGTIDEVRESGIVRSSSWIKTEYNNQSTPTSFESVSGEETQSSTTFNNNWYSGAWGYRKPIVIDHTKVNTATGTTTPLTNFPVLISLTDTDLKNNASTTGADILFTLSDGKTKLNHEIESYSTSTGQLIAWVQVPSLSNTSDTVLYMYFGNSSATGQSNKTAVWTNGYAGVWHLNDTNSSTNVADAKGNFNGTKGTNSTPSSVTNGKIAGGESFAGTSNDKISIANALNNSFGSGYTGAVAVSMWVKPANTSGNYTALWDTASRHLMFMNQNCYYGWGAASSACTNPSPGISDGQWQLVTYETGGSATNSATLCVNTACYTNSTSLGTTYTDTWVLGNNPSGAGTVFQGIEDEVHLSNTFRSADWIATEYNNQNSPSNFAALGGLQKENGNVNKTTVSSRGAGLSWYNTGGTWTNRRQIIINHNYVSQTGTTTYSNFPFLFSSVDNELKYTGSGGKVALSNGNDILFTASDGTTKLDHELESYSSTTGTTIAWIRIPLLSATADTVIYIYYGNASSGNQQNATGVWDANYKGVYHLPNGTSLTTNDSTTNGQNLTNVNATATGGQVDGAAAFNGTNAALKTTATLDLSGTNKLTISMWLNWTAFTNDDKLLFESGNPFYFSSGSLFADPDESGSGKFQLASQQSGISSSAEFARPSAGVFHYYTFVLDKSQVTAAGQYTIYIDGSSQPFTQLNANVLSGNFGNLTLNLMSRGTTSLFGAGTLDEMRISSSVRSADWVKTEYNNQNSPQTFYVLAAASNAQSRPVNVPLLKSRGGVKFH